MALINKLTNIGNAIREKTGDTKKYTLEEMASTIVNLPTGGNNSDASELFIKFSGYSAYNKPDSRGTIIIDTSNMSTLSFDALLGQPTNVSYGAYFSIFLVKIINRSYSIDGTTTTVQIPNTNSKIVTFLDNTFPSGNVLMPFSCDVNGYDKVGIYVYITPYGTSTNTGYSGECKIYNIKGE